MPYIALALILLMFLFGRAIIRGAWALAKFLFAPAGAATEKSLSDWLKSKGIKPDWAFALARLITGGVVILIIVVLCCFL